MKLDGSLYDPAYGQEHRLPKINLVEKNEENDEWEETDKTLYVDETLYNNLKGAIRNAKKYNGDLVMVIDGEEGSGKSTIARQIAKVCDKNFTHENICFSTKEFMSKSKEFPHFSALVLDESKADLDRKSTMSKKNKKFMNYLSQSRVHHKIMIIVLPSIYDLDKYVAEHRAKALIHTYKHKGEKPGYFSFYGKNGIKRLFHYDHKYRTYRTYPSFSGRFTAGEVVDLTEYNKMKQAAVDQFVDDDHEPLTKDEIIKEYVTNRLLAVEDDPSCPTQEQLSNIFGFSRKTLYNWRSERNDVP